MIPHDVLSAEVVTPFLRRDAWLECTRGAASVTGTLLAASHEAQRVALAALAKDYGKKVGQFTDAALRANKAEAERDDAVTRIPTDHPTDPSGRFMLNAYGRRCHDAGYEAGKAVAHKEIAIASRITKLEQSIRDLRDCLTELAHPEDGWPNTHIADTFERSRRLVPDLLTQERPDT